MNKSQTGAKLSDSYSSLTGSVTTGFEFFVNVPATLQSSAAILADKSLTEITRQGNRVLACSRFNQGKDRP